MVVDHFSNRKTYYVFGERFRKAFEFLETNDIRNMELGRHEIDGDDVFILVQEYTSKTVDDCGLEAHRKYADIHYVAEGFEYLGYAHISRCKETVPYALGPDASFFEKECQFVLLQEGDIAVVFPQDVHMPQRRALVGVKVRKACIKVRL
jgi:YhcH/YjgK/YiaL family protein